MHVQHIYTRNDQPKLARRLIRGINMDNYAESSMIYFCCIFVLIYIVFFQKWLGMSPPTNFRNSLIIMCFGVSYQLSTIIFRTGPGVSPQFFLKSVIHFSVFIIFIRY